VNPERWEWKVSRPAVLLNCFHEQAFDPAAPRSALTLVNWAGWALC
jgi:hypothetical protein